MDLSLFILAMAFVGGIGSDNIGCFVRDYWHFCAGGLMYSLDRCCQGVDIGESDRRWQWN